MTKPEHQKLFDDLLEIARQSADELADRAKALAYDIASRIGDDEEENAAQRAEAQAARARADDNKKKYEAGLTAMDAQLKDATLKFEQVKAAGPLAFGAAHPTPTMARDEKKCHAERRDSSRPLTSDFFASSTIFTHDNNLESTSATYSF